MLLQDVGLFGGFHHPLLCLVYVKYGPVLDKQPSPMGEQTYEKHHLSLKIEKAEQPSHSSYLQLPTL